uniref:CRTAC1 family protein n=1 Tax=Roseihalotalea indica TaxID=2867963 RepID=A0AA49GMH8_9BACT|nr:CRTAC1 family protein [Tunicatimonas sp. TK19036]
MRTVFFLFVVIVFGCSQPQPTMEQLLSDVADTAFWIPENEYASSVRAAYFDSLTQTTTDPYKLHQYEYQRAKALLFGGQTEGAIEILESMLQMSRTQIMVPGLSDYEQDQLDDLLALAYLRLGEQENCIHHHTSASCLFPILPTGFHQFPRGSEQAKTLLTNIVQDNPRDLHSRWLLNVAYMTLGEYPDQVPESYVIPPEALESEYPLKHFDDIAPHLGLAVNALSGGCVVDDFTNDGYLDVMVSSWFPDDPVQLFVNQQDGSFREVSESAGLTSVTGGLNMVQADYNNDGWLDILLLRGAWLGKHGQIPNSLLKNNGDGTFTDVTIEAGMLSFHPSQTATWNDFNQDGWLDVFIGNESSSSDNIHPCELYINNQDGTFTNFAAAAGIEVSEAESFLYIKGVTSGDYNRDGLPDIFISALDDRTSNRLYQHQGLDSLGIPRFREVTHEAGLDEKISSFPTWFFDYDNDGWLDLFVAGYQRNGTVISSITHDIAAEYLKIPHSAETARLYRNQGDGTFSNISSQVNLNRITYAMGANFGDLDNDGYLDMYMSTGEVSFASIIPNRMFRNNQGKQFQDVTTAGGFGHLQKGHAVSFADWDNDGDQDVYVVMGGAYEGDNFQNALFQNPYQNEHHWVGFQLVGTKANRSAISSKVTITLEENGQERIIYREVNSGGSFGCSPLRVAVGLGDATEVKRLEIIWNGSQTRQQWKNIAADQYYRLVEQDSALYHSEIQVIKPAI